MMKTSSTVFLFLITVMGTGRLFAQGAANCFLQDYAPKYALVPPFQVVDKTALVPTVMINLKGSDTLGEVSNYVFGNAVATWLGTDVNNPTVLGYLQTLAPSLIRYPGGSWSDVFFWNGDPGDLPDSIYDATNYFNGKVVKNRFYSQFSANVHPTLGSYYNLRDQLGTQGLITVNYAYARYGRSSNPVAQAAHYAADWVRYDNGRTEFWEIGNESAGPWEAGWLIDTMKNLDGQPAIVSGDLYGKHFKIFADSMRAAAAEVGSTIYIGGQIIHFDATNDWDVPNRKWNADFFKEVGDAADFYVMHNYFGNSLSTLKAQVDIARSTIDQNISFIRQDIANKSASPKPVALTEWNMTGISPAYADKTSIANGMQAVVLFCEMLKNNFGMSARWLVANWDTDGMFYFKSPPDAGVPLWNPRPDFFYIYYLGQVIGDHVIDVTSTGTSSVFAYATQFTSGHTGVVVVNDGSTDQVVMLNPISIGVGDQFYVYTLTGIDNSTWPQGVVVNGHRPSSTRWGPIDSLQSIQALAYSVGDSITFASPANSVEYVLIDNGSRVISSVPKSGRHPVSQFRLSQNYPNPFNPTTVISYELPANAAVRLRVYDILGREVETLVNKSQAAGGYSVTFDASKLPSGVYFYQMKAGSFISTAKMLVLK